MTLPKACAISRLSKVPISGSLPKSRSKAMSERLTSTRNDGLAQRLAQIDRLHLGLRHARKGGELVDHAADILDLADDRVGALVEDLAVLGDDLAVAAA